MLRDQFRHPQLPTVFQPHGNLPRQVVINSNRTDAVMGRAMLYAWAADHVAGPVEGKGPSATAAPRRDNEIERLPARPAEPVIVIDRNPAPGAARWQRKFQQLTNRKGPG